jgi:hypothetical protein
MSDTFHTATLDWLQTHQSFTNQSVTYSDSACRTLGPASGNLWDCYPFTRPNALTGLFAGLSLSGIPADTKYVEFYEYFSGTGFSPALVNFGQLNLWQQMTSHDWCLRTPEGISISPPAHPVHPVDLKFCVATEKESFYFDTGDWQYTSSILSKDYTQHVWRKEGVLLYGATYRSANDSVAPFLRPNYADATDNPARLDASCLFISPNISRLFGGTTVLTAGEGISICEPVLSEDDGLLSGIAATSSATLLGGSYASAILPAELSSFIIDKGYDPGYSVNWLRTISRQPPNVDSGITLVSDDELGCYKFTQNYDDCDLVTHVTRFQPSTIFVYNSCVSCCDCSDFDTDYETLRELFEKLLKLIEQYNEAFRIISDEVLPVFGERAEQITRKVRIFVMTLRKGFLLLPATLLMTQTELTLPVLEVYLRLQFRNDAGDTPITFSNVAVYAATEQPGVYLRSAEIIGMDTPSIVGIDSNVLYLTDVEVDAGQATVVSVRLFLGVTGYNEGSGMFNVAAEMGSKILFQLQTSEDSASITEKLR